MRNKSAKLLLVLTVAVLCFFGLLYFILFDALVIEPNWIRVDRVMITDAELAGALQGLTLIQISDLHLQGTLGFREKSLIGKLNRIQPDFILITGDLVESPEAIPLVEDFIRQLQPKYWTYGVLGNSDLHYLGGEGGFSERWKEAGLSLIGGRSLRLAGARGEVFWLAGVDPHQGSPGELKNKLENLTAEISPDQPLVVLAYDPDLAPTIIKAGADLVLSGDTHGGLISFPGWGRIFQKYFGRSRFIRGLYLIKNGYLYVNRGIAPKIFPVRFLCPPEITVFQFKN